MQWIDSQWSPCKLSSTCLSCPSPPSLLSSPWLPCCCCCCLTRTSQLASNGHHGHNFPKLCTQFEIEGAPWVRYVVFFRSASISWFVVVSITEWYFFRSSSRASTNVFRYFYSSITDRDPVSGMGGKVGAALGLVAALMYSWEVTFRIWILFNTNNDVPIPIYVARQDIFCKGWSFAAGREGCVSCVKGKVTSFHIRFAVQKS